MLKDVNDIEAWITETNCFEVMGQLRRLGVLSRDDLKKAMSLSRAEWVEMMNEKAGLTPEKKNESE